MSQSSPAINEVQSSIVDLTKELSKQKTVSLSSSTTVNLHLDGEQIATAVIQQPLEGGMNINTLAENTPGIQKPLTSMASPYMSMPR